MTEERSDETPLPGWTEKEATALDGSRIRFRRDGSEARIINSVVFDGEDGEALMHGVEVELEPGNTIYLSKGDAEHGAWAFDLI